MRVELINWSGHNNLGDDLMTELLLDHIPGSYNVGEEPTKKADWYILGGGTLIAPQSKFIALSPNPEKTIGISLGVSEKWNGEGVQFLKRMPVIYARDFFSLHQLKTHGVTRAKLSVDLALAYPPPKRPKHVRGIAANLMYPFGNPNPEFREELDFFKKEVSLLKGVERFALCDKEDIQTDNQATYYDSAKDLVGLLSKKDRIYATRLHANVLAWLVGCKDIVPIVYDEKIAHFYERVRNLNRYEAHEIILSHLKEVESMIYD